PSPLTTSLPLPPPTSTSSPYTTLFRSLGKMLNSFFTEVEWGDLDYLLLDLPPGTGDIAMDVHETLPSCKEIIVTTPHPTAAFVADRKSTRLNSSHVSISYAVFCLTKKN